jgi:general L-amino acid transport system permease protein
VRRNLFDSWLSTLLTLVSALVLAWAISLFWNWAFTQARWEVIPANLKIFASGTYPSSQLWRVWAVLGIVLATLGVAGGTWGGVLLPYLILLGAAMGLAAFLPLGTQSQGWLAVCSGVTFAAIALSRGRESWRLASIWVWALILPPLSAAAAGQPGPQLAGSANRATVWTAADLDLGGSRHDHRLSHRGVAGIGPSQSGRCR